MQRSRSGPEPRRRPRSVRGVRTARSAAARTSDHPARIKVARIGLTLLLVLAGMKLVQVQAVDADELARTAQRQRLTVEDVPAERGSILDRNGRPLAFSVEARALFILPRKVPEYARERKKSVEEYIAELAGYLSQEIGDQASEQEIRAKLGGGERFVYLAHQVDPATARRITKRYPEVGQERREIRQYPAGEVGANIVGVANWRADEQKVRGLVGLENFQDDLLAGRDGKRLAETNINNTVVLPGSERVLEEATPGTDLELTIDTDVQFAVQRMLVDYVEKSGAKGGSAVVLDAHTGEVYALANDKTFDPNDLASADPEHLGNPAVSAPFEPGSVNKVITAAAAIEYGVAGPDTVLQVPGSIRVADRVVHDAWPHDTLAMTFTGVLARSSNVGTLLVARQVGQERWAAMLQAFGLGQATGVGLPGESRGQVPPVNQWSQVTFGNLPIGQGLSVTLLQMAGMYQAIANDGVRVPPRIVRAEIGPDGVRRELPRPDPVKVVSPETARTVRDMLRAVVQDAPGQRGTGAPAALPGYQISGKTGTAQQVDRACGCYSDSKYWITFAGILPADKPRFVIGLVLDAPQGNGEFSRSAAPLFHDIAAYLAQRYQIPLSKEPAPVMTLTVR
ncbi:MAG TPA: penicillin-binding protein 2 [Pseudonocardiaceae bacterium]